MHYLYFVIYACMCIIYACAYKHTLTISVNIYKYMHMYKYTYMQKYMYLSSIYLPICLSIHTYTHIYPHVPININTWVRFLDCFY